LTEDADQQALLGRTRARQAEGASYAEIAGD
jgi:hypothetical protein